MPTGIAAKNQMTVTPSATPEIPSTSATSGSAACIGAAWDALDGPPPSLPSLPSARASSTPTGTRDVACCARTCAMNTNSLAEVHRRRPETA